MNLQTIPRGLVSPGSACLIAAAPVEWIASFPIANPVTNNIETDITLHPGRAWLRLILASRKRTLKHSNNRSAAGATYPATITGNTVGTSNIIHHLLAMYTLHRWVILYTEAGSGITYIIGHPKAGALLSYEYNNQNATQSAITISHTGTAPMPVYQGSYTLDNSVTVAPGDTALQVLFYTATGNEPNNTHVYLPALQYRTLLFVSRPVFGDLQPVSATPSGMLQIQWDPLSATAIVSSDYPLSPNEQLTFLYR